MPREHGPMGTYYENSDPEFHLSQQEAQTNADLSAAMPDMERFVSGEKPVTKRDIPAIEKQIERMQEVINRGGALDMTIDRYHKLITNLRQVVSEATMSEIRSRKPGLGERLKSLFSGTETGQPIRPTTAEINSKEEPEQPRKAA